MAADENEVALKIIFNDLSGNRIEVDGGFIEMIKIIIIIIIIVR